MNIDSIIVATAFLLLSIAAQSAWHAYRAYQARCMAADFRDVAQAKLQDIIRDQSANQDARQFAEHLSSCVADSDVMLDQVYRLLRLSAEDEDEERTRRVNEFRKRLGEKWQKKFDEIFPLLTTASFLLHPVLGRMYYVTFKKTIRASIARHTSTQLHVDQQKEVFFRVTPNVPVEALDDSWEQVAACA